MFVAALLILANNWKKGRCLSSGERINKLWCIHTMKSYAAVKRNELLIHSSTWVNLKCILLSEKRQKTKATYCIHCMVLFI